MVADDQCYQRILPAIELVRNNQRSFYYPRSFKAIRAAKEREFSSSGTRHADSKVTLIAMPHKTALAV